MNTETDLVLIHPPYHRRLGSGYIYPIGLGYLASSAEAAGYQVSIIDCATTFFSLRPAQLENLGPWLTHRLEATRPKLAIGIGPCTTSAVRGILMVAAICRKLLPNIPLIFGGPLASLSNQSALFFEEFGATAIVPGDGDTAICEILNALSHGREISELSCVTTPIRTNPNNVINDLDLMPFPRREWANDGATYTLSARRNLFTGKFATMITSRGCPHRCKFCVSGILRGGRYSRRSTANVIAEIRELQSTHGVRTIIFYDDTFFSSIQTLSEDATTFANAIAGLPAPPAWEIEMRPDILAAFDRKLASTLFAAGCRQFNVGIERANTPNLDLIGKEVDVSRVTTAVDEIRAGAPGLRLAGTFIIGGPHETYHSILKSVELAKNLVLLFAHFYPLEVYPETVAYKDCYPEDGPHDWFRRIMSDDLPWGELLYETTSMKRSDLLSAVAEAYKLFYKHPDWHRRASNALGTHYRQVANAVDSWCSDRFAIREGII